MPCTVRRLGPDDWGILSTTAREDADFDLEERGRPVAELSPEAARAYLTHPDVLHWVAELDGRVVGFLTCNVVHKRNGHELLLYEIGVRAAQRKRGIGRRLLDEMFAWMSGHGLDEVWVLADNPGAVEFYLSCGFHPGEGQATYLTRELAR